jgi:FdhD protein
LKTSDNSARPVEIATYRDGELIDGQRDEVAVEEPLELRIEGRNIAIVMRTPGNDRELAAGFLVTEGIVRHASEIFEITQCLTSRTAGENGNMVEVTLKNPSSVDFTKLTRHVFSSSSCGVCGKASIDAVRQQFAPITSTRRISAALLPALPDALSAAQETFKKTGGLHACALFDWNGKLIGLREDVGRHNALDKLIGHALLQNHLPLSEHMLLLSGRVSFEMMQKALAAGIPLVAAISAPSSLAIEFAQENNQTLIGFLRGNKMNIYAGAERIG